jgi:hypothetical protein
MMVAPSTRAGAKVAAEGALWGLKLLVIVVLVLEALYVLVANVVLSTGLPRKWLRREPDRAMLEYDSAWTVIPGWFHVRGFAYVSLGSTPWLLEIPRGDVRVELGELSSRTLHVTRLRGDEAVLRVRTSLDQAEWDSPRAQAMPPIRGYSDANRPMVTPKPPPTDEDYDRWMVQLENIDGTLRELWIQEYRYVGKMRVRGGFLIRPERIIAVSPARIDILGGELHLAEHRVASEMSGDVDVVFGPFDPRTVERAAMRHLSGRVRSSAQLDSLEFVNFYLPEDGKLRLHDGSGALDWDISILHGILLAGSRFELRTERLDVRTPKLTAVTEAKVVMEAPRHGVVRAEASAPLSQLYRPKVDRLPPSIEHARARVELPGDLGESIRPKSADLEVRRMKIPDLGWLHEPAEVGDKSEKEKKKESASPRLTGGAAELSGKLHVDGDGRASGKASARFDQASVQWYGVDIAGWASSEIEIDSIDFATKTAHMRSRFEARDVAIRHGDDIWPGWWSSTDFDRFELGGSPFGVRFDFRSKSRDARPVVEILTAKGAVPGWIAKMIRHEGMVASGKLLVRADGAIDFVLKGAQSSGVDAAGRATKSGKKSRGVFLVDGGPLSVGIEYAEGHKPSLKPLADKEWLAEKLNGR